MEASQATPAKITRKSNARRMAMLQAAHHLFAEKGFEATTLADILAISGGSRNYLYKFFGNKHGLLQAVLEDSFNYILPVFIDLEQRTQENISIRDNLTQFGIEFLEALLSPPILANRRIFHGGLHLFPYIGKEFIRHGPEVGWKYLSRYFKTNLPQIKDPLRSVHILIGAIKGEFILISNVGLRSSITEQDIKDHVEATIDFFLKAVNFDSSQS